MIDQDESSVYTDEIQPSQKFYNNHRELPKKFFTPRNELVKQLFYESTAAKKHYKK